MKPTTSVHDGTARHAERLAVMISSTSLDLPHHRETVNEAIRRVGYFPLAMEHGSAEAGSNALTYSLRMVDQADLFIGILAFRYGYVPDDPVANPNGWSVTEHEYRRALQRGIPVLIFLMDAAHPDARKDAELSEPAQRKLEALKAELKTKHICGFFCSVDQLQARVIQSLSEIKISVLQRHGQHGSSRPFQSPPVPAHYIRRPKEENRLEDDLLRHDEGPGVVVSAVFGLGGIGKSTLAAAVVQSQRVQERFADGLLWVTLGQNPELLSLLGQWIRDLGDHEFRAMDVRSVSGRLRQLLQDRAVLLVVDDAWQSEHVEPFQVGGPHCRLLVTTRKPRIADDLHAISHELDVLSPEQAVELLATRLQRPLREDERGPALRLTEAVGRLPLALELAAVRLGRGVAWEDLLRKLEQEVAALEALEDPAERWKKKVKTQLEASLQLSLRALRAEAEEAFRCFIWLGVLPDDTTLAAPMASALWDLTDADEADGLLEFLWGEALLQPAVPVRVGGKQWRAYRVHDLLHDCAARLLETEQTPRRQEELPGLGLTRPEAHRQLLGRYRKQTRDGLWNTLAADGYIHGRLGWHLEKAGDAEGLHALLREETAEGRNGWFEANERLGQPAQFVDCVAQAWRLADVAFSAGLAVETLSLQCRYALVTASLNSLAGNLPPALMKGLVQHRQWSLEQALVYARLTSDPQQQVKAFATLLPFFSLAERSAVLAETLTAARAIEGEQPRLQALAEVATQLPEQERPVVLAEALRAARAIGNQPSRSQSLATVASYLPKPERTTVLAEALKEACAIDFELTRSKALAALTPHLPVELLGEALRATRALGDLQQRSRGLGALVMHLPEQERPGVLAEALCAARIISHDGSRSKALGALVMHLPEAERAAVLAEALSAARAESESYPEYLAALGPQLPEPDRAAVLAECLLCAARILLIKDDPYACEALKTLAPQLPAGLLPQALRATRAIEYPPYRASTLAALGPRLSEPERTAVLIEALNCARAILGGWPGVSSQVLKTLAPHLPVGLLEDAWIIACKLDNPVAKESQAQALEALAAQLPAELLAQALCAVRAIRDQQYRSRALAVVALQLPQSERRALLNEALYAARAIQSEWDRSPILVALAAQWPEAERATVLNEALCAARAIENEEYRSRALAAVASQSPDQERPVVLAEALSATHGIKDGKSRAAAVAGLVPQLPEAERSAVLAQALCNARVMKDRDDASHALVVLGAQLREPERTAVLVEAVNAGCGIRHEISCRDEAGTPSQHPPESGRLAVLAEILCAVCAIRHEGLRAWALTALAPAFPTEMLSEALTAACAIESERYRSQAMLALAPQLPARLLSQALCATRAIRDNMARAQLLAALGPQLPEPDRGTVLAEALSAARAIKNEQPRSRVLAALAPHLPTELQVEVLSDACALRNCEARSQTLEALAAHLAFLSCPRLLTMWTETLHLLATRTRPDLLADLCSLTTIFVALAGPNGQTELREIAHAITDVAQWWP